MSDVLSAIPELIGNLTNFVFEGFTSLPPQGQGLVTLALMAAVVVSIFKPALTGARLATRGAFSGLSLLTYGFSTLFKGLSWTTNKVSTVALVASRFLRRKSVRDHVRAELSRTPNMAATTAPVNETSRKEVLQKSIQEFTEHIRRLAREA